MDPLTSIRQRCKFWWKAIHDTWGFLMLIIAGVWGIISFYRDEILPESFQADYQIGDFFPQWSLEKWALVGVSALLIIVAEAGYRAAKKLQMELDILNTPSTSIDLSMIDEPGMQDTQTVFLEVRGQSATPVRVEVFAARANTICSGHQYLYRPTGAASAFTLSRGEPHHIPAVIYAKRDLANSLRVAMPCKIPVADSVCGGAFLLLVHAFGGPKTAELEFHFGVTDDGTLWAQQVGSTKRLISHMRDLLTQPSSSASPETNMDSADC